MGKINAAINKSFHHKKSINFQIFLTAISTSKKHWVIYQMSINQYRAELGNVLDGRKISCKEI